jgi:putative endonuclease
MQFTVYILYSAVYNKHYTGFTSNLAQRLLSHNELGKAFTSKFRPWELIYTKQFSSRAAAVTHERWLKSGAGRDYIKTLPH